LRWSAAVVGVVLLAIGITVRNTFRGAAFLNTLWTVVGVFVFLALLEIALMFAVGIAEKNAKTGVKKD
jgi:hypothetical protein